MPCAVFVASERAMSRASGPEDYIEDHFRETLAHGHIRGPWGFIGSFRVVRLVNGKLEHDRP